MVEQILPQENSASNKLPFADAQDGISNTFSIIPNALGKEIVTSGDLEVELELDEIESNE